MNKPPAPFASIAVALIRAILVTSEPRRRNFEPEVVCEVERAAEVLVRG